MKRIVSVSLGSSKRDHSVETKILGETFFIERIGTDGDIKKLISIIKELDGRVDAFGMGGIDIYLQGPNKRYIIKDSKPILEAAKLTPIYDGSILKNTLEKTVIKYIDKNLLPLKEKRILMTSAVDRYGMAMALYESGADITFGDIMFGLKLPIPIKSFKSFNMIIRILLPIVVNMPFEILYPIGGEQDTITTRYEKYYKNADIIAGDYIFIKKYMPQDLFGKIIITNTITSDDIQSLKSRGVHMLITTTPEFNGRSFGTNVIEGLLSVIIGKNKESITPSDYEDIIETLNISPRVEYLNETVNNEVY